MVKYRSSLENIDRFSSNLYIFWNLSKSGISTREAIEARKPEISKHAIARTCTVRALVKLDTAYIIKVILF